MAVVAGYRPTAGHRASHPRSALQKIPSRHFFARHFAPRVVIPSMHAPVTAVPKTACGLLQAGFAVPGDGVREISRDRHATCMPSVFLEKDSHSLFESVDFSGGRATVSRRCEHSTNIRSRSAAPRCSASSQRGAVQSGWNHGAARNGNRKRTRVRVACGGGIRPLGLGHQPIHGHFGLSVVGREHLSPVVHLPACELRVRQRHFSRGPGLLAALTTRVSTRARHDSDRAPTSSSQRRLAHHPTAWATRPGGATVISAASVLKCRTERPAAGKGAHQPSPRTRLRQG